MNEETCHRCGVEMWTEGSIQDDIKLCHPCYVLTYEKKESDLVNA